MLEIFSSKSWDFENSRVATLVISICETWIRPTHSEPYSKSDGYKFVLNNRKACLGGGVVFYVKNSLQFNVINELFVMEEKNFESLFSNVQVG